MLALSLIAALFFMVVIGFGIAGATKAGLATVTRSNHNSSVDGPIRKSKVATTDLGVKAEASSFRGRNWVVRVQGGFSPSDAAEHPRVAFLLIGGFCGLIAAFGLFWFAVVSDAVRWLAVPIWLMVAAIAIGYPRRVRAEQQNPAAEPG